MSEAPANPRFTNFKDAFCHVYRCKPDRYERRLFFASLHTFRTLFALPIWWFNRPLFAVDLDAIINVGRTASIDDFNNALSDFENANHIERSIRRGLFRIRISGPKLSLIRENLDHLIDVPVVVNVLEGAKVTVDAGPGMPGRAGTGSPRRLREVHRDLTSGKPLAEVLLQAKVTEEELIRELEEAGRGTPEMLWLRDYLLQLQRLRTADQELSDLRRVLSAQAHELLELRSGGSTPGN